MSEKAKTLQLTCQLNRHLFLNCLEDIPAEFAQKSFNDHVASMAWIAAHLANTRCHIVRQMGGKTEIPWDEKVGGPNSEYNPAETYPSLEEIRDVWEEITPKLEAHLSKVPDEVLDADGGSGLPFHDTSVLGRLTFLAAHESYHIGQLGFLRKLSGAPSMSYAPKG